MIINIKGSRFLTLAALIVYPGGALAAWSSALPAPWALLVSAALAYGLWRTLAVHARRSSAAAVTRVEWAPDDTACLGLGDGRRMEACRVSRRWVAAGLVICVFRCRGGATVSLVVARDAVDADSLRGLRVRLESLPPA